LFAQAEEIVVTDPSDAPSHSDMIDAALTHLIDSQINPEDVRATYPPNEIKAVVIPLCCDSTPNEH